MTHLLTPQRVPTPHSSKYLGHSLYPFKEFDVLIVKAEIPTLRTGSSLPSKHLLAGTLFSLESSKHSDQSVLPLLPGTQCFEALGPKEQQSGVNVFKTLEDPQIFHSTLRENAVSEAAPTLPTCMLGLQSLFACKTLRDGHTKYQTLDRNQTVTSPPSQHSMQIRAPGSSWDLSAEPSDSQFLSHQAGPGRLPADVLQLEACCRPGTVPPEQCARKPGPRVLRPGPAAASQAGPARLSRRVLSF